MAPEDGGWGKDRGQRQEDPLEAAPRGESVVAVIEAERAPGLAHSQGAKGGMHPRHLSHTLQGKSECW